MGTTQPPGGGKQVKGDRLSSTQKAEAGQSVRLAYIIHTGTISKQPENPKQANCKPLCHVSLQLVSLSDLLLLGARLLGLSLEGCFESAIPALRPGRLPLAG